MAMANPRAKQVMPLDAIVATGNLPGFAPPSACSKPKPMPPEIIAATANRQITVNSVL